MSVQNVVNRKNSDLGESWKERNRWFQRQGGACMCRGTICDL